MSQSFLKEEFSLVTKINFGNLPQFFTIMAATVAFRIKACQFVFELRNMWPASINSVGLMSDGCLFRCFACIEMFCSKRQLKLLQLRMHLNLN